MMKREFQMWNQRWIEGETPSEMEVERALRDAGFTLQQAKAFAAEGYGAISAQRYTSNWWRASITQRLKSIFTAGNRNQSSQ